MAVLVEKALESPAKFWLNLQIIYDEAKAREGLEKKQISFEIEKIITNRKSTQKRIDFKVKIITLSAHEFDIAGTEIKESEGANRA